MVQSTSIVIAVSGDKSKAKASKKPHAFKQSEGDDLKALANSLKPGPRIGATGDRFELEDALGWIQDSTPKMPSVPLLPERINPAA